jgi:hypothetical protein
LDSTDESLMQLIEKSKKFDSVFHVNKIEFPRESGEICKKPGSLEKEMAQIPKEREEETVTSVFVPDINDVLDMLELFLSTMEKIVENQKNIRDHFSTLLKRKFVEKVNRYDFLDPFEAAFEYHHQKISFFGDTSPKELASGVIESVQELAVELGVEKEFKKETQAWVDKYSKTLRQLGINYQ